MKSKRTSRRIKKYYHILSTNHISEAKQTTDIVDVEKDDDSVPGSDKSTCTTRPKTPTSVQMETETTNDTTPLNEQ